MANNSGSSLLADYNEAYFTKIIPNTVVIFIFLVVGILGNTLVIYVYECRFPRSDGRCFIGPLAFFDLGAIIFTSALNLLQNFMKFTFHGQFLCKFVHFFSYAFINTSLFLWTIIAVQRYRKICKPFAWQMKKDRRKWLILIFAVLALVFFSPILYFYGINENPLSYQDRNVTAYVCEQTKTDKSGLVLYQGIGLILSLGNVICIICIYTVVLIKIYKVVRGARKSRSASIRSDSAPLTTLTSSKSISGEKSEQKGNTLSSENSDQQNSKIRIQHRSTSSETQKMEHTIAFTFMTILLIGLLSYAPSRTLLVYESIDPQFWKNWENFSYGELNIFLFLRRSYIFNHSCNVFVYLFFDTMFRKEVKSLMGFK